MDGFEAKSKVLSILHATTPEDAAVRRVYEQYAAPVISSLRVARRIPAEDAEDLVHEFWTQKLLVPAAVENIVAMDFESMRLVPRGAHFHSQLHGSFAQRPSESINKSRWQRNGWRRLV